MSFNYKVKLPEYGEIRLTPLTVGQYKDIIQFLVNKDIEGLVIFIKSLVNIELSPVDLLVLLLQLRKISCGEVIDLSISDKNGINPAIHRITVDNIIDNIYNIVNGCDYLVSTDRLSINIGLPRNITDIQCLYDTARYVDDKISMEIIHNFPLHKLPDARIGKIINEHREKVDKVIKKYPLIKIPNIDSGNDITFYLNINGYKILDILPYVYGENLDGLYEQIFGLVHNLKISMEYTINNMTPIEAMLYIAKYNKMMKQQKSDMEKSNNHGHSIGTPQSIF